MLQSVNVNGINYTFDVIHDLTEPCPHCGVPACGKENYFWYEESGRRKTLILDGEILDLIIQQFFTTKMEKVEYAKLPGFLRESNECTGWSEARDFSGTAIDIDDLLLALEAIELTDLEDWMRADGDAYITALNSIATTAKKKQLTLSIARS